MLGWEQGSYLLGSVTLRWHVQTAPSRLPSSRESAARSSKGGVVLCAPLWAQTQATCVWSCSPAMLTHSPTSETHTQVNTNGCEGNLEISVRKDLDSCPAQPAVGVLTFRVAICLSCSLSEATHSVFGLL